jgi:hypothetical protein
MDGSHVAAEQGSRGEVGENGRERDEGEVCLTCGLHRWVDRIEDDIEYGWMQKN